MLMRGSKPAAAAFLFILLFVSMSGCAEMFKALQEYVPSPSPGPSVAPVEIGSAAPASMTKGVTITGNGHTVTFRGSGPYNVNARQDLFTLNEGNADIAIKLKGQGYGCSISMDYANPFTGNTEILPIHQFTTSDRRYDPTMQVRIPYTARYCLMVNWGGDWELSITQ
jgi:hypothetical protein